MTVYSRVEVRTQARQLRASERTSRPSCHGVCFFALLCVDIEVVDTVGSSAWGFSTFCKKLKRIFCIAFFFFFKEALLWSHWKHFTILTCLVVHVAHCFTHSNPPVMLFVHLVRSWFSLYYLPNSGDFPQLRAGEPSHGSPCPLLVPWEPSRRCRRRTCHTA